MPDARRTQANRSSATSADLIRAAEQLLAEVGYAGTTTALIARRAGVTTGALHHHFPTKDALMLGVLDRSADRVLAQIERHLPFGRDGWDDVAGLVRHLWDVYGDPDYWAVWEIIIGTRADAAFHRLVVQHRSDTMRRVLPSWVERHGAAKPSRSELGLLFEFVLIAIRGLGLERFLDQDQRYFDRQLDLLADLVARRLAVPRTEGDRP